MLLAVDVGNTHTVLALYDGARLAHHFRIESAKGRTSDELHVLVRQLLALVNGLVAAAEECQIVIDAHPSMRSAAHRARRVG